MDQLQGRDLQLVVTRLPKAVRAMLVDDSHLMIAGGYIRATIAGERPSDIDIFGSHQDQLELAAYKLSVKQRARIHKTENAWTVLNHPRTAVQFIKRWVFQGADAVVKSFDFTICQVAVWWDKAGGRKNAEGIQGGCWASACSGAFYKDLAARRLVYTAPERNEDAGGSILRVRKFVANGYNIQAPSLAAVIARLVKNLDTTQMQLTDEPHVTQVLTGLLREVDPLMIVDGLEFVDEHELGQEIADQMPEAADPSND
jgi:hypothetical protein